MTNSIPLLIIINIYKYKQWYSGNNWYFWPSHKKRARVNQQNSRLVENFRVEDKSSNIGVLEVGKDITGKPAFKDKQDLQIA